MDLFNYYVGDVYIHHDRLLFKFKKKKKRKKTEI